jgi:hypothetical protein
MHFQRPSRTALAALRRRPIRSLSAIHFQPTVVAPVGMRSNRNVLIFIHDIFCLMPPFVLTDAGVLPSKEPCALS